MSEYTLYHNPRCSKSRSALEILRSKGIEPTIIYYLETPLDAKALKNLLKELNISARELLRKNEEEYKALNPANEYLTETQLIDAMVKYPKLIERPIFKTKNGATIARPPEKILELLD